MSHTQCILWTAGWDSTFQLVRSLLTDSSWLQPIYLVDEDRASTAMELRAMRKIKRRIRTDFPARADLLLPVQLAAVSDLRENADITRAFANLRQRYRIGVQYDWLGRFCHQFGVAELDLCIHRDDKAHAVLQHVVESGPRGGYRVSERHVGTPEHELFKPYSFPVFDLTKLQMREIAEEMGFDSIMNLTWFCHAPRNGKPCGLCNPCRYTIEEGLGSRVPRLQRLKGSLFSTGRRLAKAGLSTLPFWRNAGTPSAAPSRVQPTTR